MTSISRHRGNKLLRLKHLLVLYALASIVYDSITAYSTDDDKVNCCIANSIAEYCTIDSVARYHTISSVDTKNLKYFRNNNCSITIIRRDSQNNAVFFF